MATPPTPVAQYESVWNTSTTPKTVSVTTAVGDRLICCAINESMGASRSLNTPTGGTGLTWTLDQSYAVTNQSMVSIWTATATTAETFTCSVTVTNGGTGFWGFEVQRWSGSDGFGASGKAQASGAPSLALTTQGDDSALAVYSGDWNAIDGTTRTVRAISGAAFTETAYFRDSARYTLYGGYYDAAGPAGAKTVGWSAPTGQAYSLVAVEIKGAAGPPPVPEEGTFNSSAMATMLAANNLGGMAA